LGGCNNLFRHPAPSTIATLAHAGAQIYRTDEDGAVTIDADGGEGNRITTLIAPR
jgi:competence protein ComEC